MKAPFFLLAVVMLAGLPSCDKARDLTKKLGKKPPSATAAAAAPYTGALVSEITKDEFDRFSKQTGRVVLIDSIDDLETAGANALLKSLEEPPVGTIFC